MLDVEETLRLLRRVERLERLRTLVLVIVPLVVLRRLDAGVPLLILVFAWLVLIVRMRGKVIRGVYEVVSAAENLVGITLEGWGTWKELDSKLSELLEVPNDTVSLETGLQLMMRKRGGAAKGCRRPLGKALELVGRNMLEFARDGRLLTFWVALRREPRNYYLRGIVVPLGRRQGDGAPMVALLGVGDDEGHRKGPFAFGGVIPIGRTFSGRSRGDGDGKGNGWDGSGTGVFAILDDAIEGLVEGED